MIFYTLFKIYPNVDKTNIILTALIIYIIIYIGIDEDYNYIAILVLTIIDFGIWKYNQPSKKHKKKKHHRRHKKVRFSNVNNVRTIANRYEHEHEQFENPRRIQNFQYGHITPQQAQMTQINAPLWGMMTRQVNPFKIKPEVKEPLVDKPQNALIDNRHLAFKESADYLNSDVSSNYSDSSSDLSNTEEEY
jgi:hypothetical protein